MRQIHRLLNISWIHRLMVILFVVSTAITFGLMLSACAAPTWLTDAQSIVTLVSASVVSILTFFAATDPALAGSLAAVTAIFTDIQNGLTDIEQLVAQYNANPSNTLLQNIEAAAQVVITNLQKVLADTFPGLPTALITKIVAIAQLMLTQFEAWSSLLPTLAAHAGDHVSISIPYTTSEYKAMFNQILDTPTGDPSVDAALAKTKRL